MSGCENPLDYPNENRDTKAVQENNAWTVAGEYCLGDGGLVVERRLRRVIRKLPILGADPQQGRLSTQPAIRYKNIATVPPNSGSRPPVLLLDFYLSWMSLVFSVPLASVPLSLSPLRSLRLCVQ